MIYWSDLKNSIYWCYRGDNISTLFPSNFTSIEVGDYNYKRGFQRVSRRRISFYIPEIEFYLSTNPFSGKIRSTFIHIFNSTWQIDTVPQITFEPHIHSKFQKCTLQTIKASFPYLDSLKTHKQTLLSFEKEYIHYTGDELTITFYEFKFQIIPNAFENSNNDVE